MSDSTSTGAPDNAGVRIPPPLLFAAPWVIGYLIQRRWPIGIVPPSVISVAHIVGAVCIIAAVGTMALAVGSFRRARTSVVPVRPTTAIVVRGPYRITRNPMYVAFAILYAGASLALNALWPLLFLPVSIVATRRMAIDREERYLTRKFGADYVAYTARVRRWL